MPNDMEKMKEARTALNARMLLLFAGIMLVLNGIMQTGRNGLGWINMAKSVEEYQMEQGDGGAGTDPETEAVSENAASEPETETVSEAAEEETEFSIGALVDQMKEAGVTTGDLKQLGYGNLIAAVFEILCGLICALFANRVDRWKYTLGAVAALLCVEVIYMLFAFSKNAMAISNLIYAILLPLVLLWSALKMRKLAKADPERIYAVEQQPRNASGRKEQGGSQGGAYARGGNAPAPGGRSLRDRAMMRPAVEPEEEEKTESGPSDEE